MEKIFEIKNECNTFTFFVEKRKIYKYVIVEQLTSFTGTILEEDFPNGSKSIREIKVFGDYSDIKAVNIAGKNLLKNWVDLPNNYSM